MDGDHLSPSGFGVGAAATLGAALGTTVLAIGANVAEVVATAREEDAWERVQSGMQKLMATNEALTADLAKERSARESLLNQFSEILGVAMRQSRQLDALREAGLIA